MTTRTLANSLEELDTLPFYYETYRRIFLWKYFLYATLGERNIDDVNKMLKELEVLVLKYRTCTAIQMLISPDYRPSIILHKYPEITKRSIEYILHGTGEELIEESALVKAEACALNCIRTKLEDIYKL